LEKKYRLKRLPFYEQRRKIISGEVEVESAPAEEGAPAEAQAQEESDIKGIPGFWFQALGNHPVTGDFMTEEDAPALGALDDIKIEYDETYTSFVLTFEFKENAFFTNTVLTKKYTLTDILDESSPQLIDVEGSVIDWKEGKNLTVKEIKKKQKAKAGKNKGQIRTITRNVPKPSFFHFFATPKSNEEDHEEEEEEEADKERITLNEEEDFEIAHVIRTAILPNAILWYTGEAREDDYDFGEEEDDEEGDEEDGPDGEAEDDESEEDKPQAKGKGKGKGGKNSGGFAGAAPAAGGEQPECKQN